MSGLTPANQSVQTHDLDNSFFNNDGDLIQHNGAIPLSTYDASVLYPDGTIFVDTDGGQQTYSGGALGVKVGGGGGGGATDGDAWDVVGEDETTAINRTGNVGVSDDSAFVPTNGIETHNKSFATNNQLLVHAWASTSDGSATTGNYGTGTAKLWANGIGSTAAVPINAATPELYLGSSDSLNNLHVSGSIKAETAQIGTAAIVSNGDIDTVTSAQEMNAGAFNVTSDQRLKTDKLAVNGEKILASVTGLEISRYKLHDARTGEVVRRNGLGLMAQDLQKVFPEFVKSKETNVSDNPAISGDSADMLSVDYQGLVPVLISCIKELNSRLEAVEK